MSWECNWGIWEIVISTHVYVVSKVVSKKKKPSPIGSYTYKVTVYIRDGFFSPMSFYQEHFTKIL